MKNPYGTYKVIANLHNSVASVAEGSLLYASDGNFYAESLDGGYQDSCTVFRCTPNGMLTTVINLDSVWGASGPLGNSLMEASDHNLYGMTYMGGSTLQGVLFRYQLNGHYDSIHTFTGGNDGSHPNGSLIQTPDGNLWGMTTSGGTSLEGVIFKCSVTGALTSIHEFSGTDGREPMGDLLLASDSNFYGMTSLGGLYNLGVLFRITQAGVYTKLVDFDSTNGAYPQGSLIQGTDGNLYGLTSGLYQTSPFDSTIILNPVMAYGTLFSCTLSGTLTTLHTFGRSGGFYPMGTLFQGTDGMLYGMTYMDSIGSGTIFKSTTSGTLTTIHIFNDTNGAFPMYGKLIIPNTTESIQEINKSVGVSVFPNPFTNSTTIQVESGKYKGENYLELYDLTGQKLKTIEFKGNTYILSAEGLANGMYFIRVYNGNENVIGTSKIVIQ